MSVVMLMVVARTIVKRNGALASGETTISAKSAPMRLVDAQRGLVLGPVSAAIANVNAVAIVVQQRESVAHCRLASSGGAADLRSVTGLRGCWGVLFVFQQPTKRQPKPHLILLYSSIA